MLTPNLLGGTIVKGNGAAGSYALADSFNPTGMLQLTFSFLEKGLVEVTGGRGRVDASYSVAAGENRPGTGTETAYVEVGFSVPISIATLSGKGYYSVGMGLGTGVGQTMVISS